MAVKNLECQLAMAQLRRYLAGAALSDDALEALEGHLALCPDCQREVADRRSELVVSGQSNAPSHAVVNLPNPQVIQHQQQAALQTPAVALATENAKPAPKPKNAKQETGPKQSIGMKLLQSGLNQPWIEKIPGGAKTFLLSVGLAGLLVAMSTLSQNPKSWLGESADSAIADNLVREESSKDNSSGAARYELSKYDGANATATDKVVLGSSVDRPEPKTAVANSNATPNTNQNVKLSEPTTTQAKPVADPAISQKPDSKARTTVEKVSRPMPKTATTTRSAITTKPRRNTTKPAARRTWAKRTPTKSTIKPRSKPNSGVRIYDENGNAIN